MNTTWEQGSELPELKDSNLLAEGSHARVYLLGDQAVVRRLKNYQGSYPNANLMIHLKQLGFPTPILFEARQDTLVMERLHGPTLLQSLIAQEISLAEAARIMAQLHEHLHALQPPDSSSTNDQLGDEDRILHMDIHPGTIVLTPAGPYLVDWEDSRLGPPELDLAATALVFAMIASEPGELQDGAASMFRKFSRTVGTGFVPYLEAAARVRAQEMDTSPEELALIQPGLQWAHAHLQEFPRWCVPTRQESTQ